MLYIGEIEFPSVENGKEVARVQVYTTEADSLDEAREDFRKVAQRIRDQIKVGNVAQAGPQTQQMFRLEKQRLTGEPAPAKKEAPIDLETYLQRLDKLRTRVQQRQAAGNLLTFQEAALQLNCKVSEVRMMAEDAGLNINVGWKTGRGIALAESEAEYSLEDLSV